MNTPKAYSARSKLGYYLANLACSVIGHSRRDQHSDGSFVCYRCHGFFDRSGQHIVLS